LGAKHEALRATVWALRARLRRFGLGGFGVAGAPHRLPDFNFKAATYALK
jgi:hypothetical protein